MTTKHQVGEKVRVTIEGVVTEVDGEHGEHIEIMYAFTERLKGTLGVLPEALAVTIEPLENGALAGENPLKLGDVWRDSDNDLWRVVSFDSRGLGLTLGNGNGWDAWAYVEENYGPLTFVKHADDAPVATVPGLKLGDRWTDRDGDTWRVGRVDDGTLRLVYGGIRKTWDDANEQFGPMTFVGGAS